MFAKKIGMGLATEDCRDVWGVRQLVNHVTKSSLIQPKAAYLSWCEFLKLSSLSKVTSVTNSLNHKSHQVVIIVLIVMVLVLSLSSCWSHQLSLPLRSIVRKVKSVLGNSEVPDGYLGLGHLLSCHCWQAPNTYWHRSPCLCQNNKKPFSKGSREQRQQGQGVHSPARAL